MPARLAARPRDARGYPIPFVALTSADGTPDFRVTDVRRWALVVKLGHCGLCNAPLGRHRCLVGGPLSMKSRLFTDPPMHRDCAEYALQVCPYLAAPNFRYAESLRMEQGVAVHVTHEVSGTRPDTFYLGITRSCRPLQTPDGTLALQAEAWTAMTAWQGGRLLDSTIQV